MKLPNFYCMVITILILFNCNKSVFGQHKKELSVHTGYILSLNDLRSRPYNGNKFFSSKDWALSAQFSYQVYGNFYLGIKGNASFLKTRQDGIKEAVKNYILEEWDGGKYRMYNILAGPKYCVPLNGKINISCAIMGGIGIMKVTDIGMVLASSHIEQKNLIKEIYKFNNSFCMEGEVECDYHLSHHLSLNLNIAYFSQTFNQDFLIVNSSPYYVPVGVGNNYPNKMNAGMLVPSLGVKYAF